MRDSQIYSAFQELTSNLSNDVMTMHDMNVLTKTRIEAMETVLTGSRFAPLKCLIFPLFNKNYIANAILDEHERLLQEYKDRIKKAQQVKKAASLSVIHP